MSYFVAPDSATPNYIFGSPTSFQQTCRDLSLPVLAELPIDSRVASKGDAGAPVMIGVKVNEQQELVDGMVKSGFAGGSNASTVEDEFGRLARQVWQKIV